MRIEHARVQSNTGYRSKCGIGATDLFALQRPESGRRAVFLPANLQGERIVDRSDRFNLTQIRCTVRVNRSFLELIAFGWKPLTEPGTDFGPKFLGFSEMLRQLVGETLHCRGLLPCCRGGDRATLPHPVGGFDENSALVAVWSVIRIHGSSCMRVHNRE